MLSGYPRLFFTGEKTLGFHETRYIINLNWAGAEAGEEESDERLPECMVWRGAQEV